MEEKDNLLLVTHVGIREGPRGKQIDDQTAAGIIQWCNHFNKVIYYGIATDDKRSDNSSTSWVDVNEGLLGKRSTILALPRAYNPAAMARHFKRTYETLAQAVAQCRYLSFTIGGLIGDWPAVAAISAIHQKRNYSAWIDRVEPSIIQNKLINAPLVKRLAAASFVPLMENYTKYILRRSTVALLQGRDTFDHYKRWARNPYCTYDTHTIMSDQISAIELEHKTAATRAQKPLDIIYAGRAAAMKGPFDWLRILQTLHDAKVPFRAAWIGDGPELPAMRSAIAASKISDFVKLQGFEGNRHRLLSKLRSSDFLLFCHKTPESPRCLIEALVSGCPIIGYSSGYPQGLVEERGGGLFAPKDDIDSLVAHIIGLHHDRNLLAELINQAANSGMRYNEDDVYAQRAKLMKSA